LILRVKSLIKLVSNICESWEKKIGERKEKNVDVLIDVRKKGEKKKKRERKMISWAQIVHNCYTPINSL
jgi:divalent metal cation (Fe/Co/Zn/Cd) transporter